MTYWWTALSITFLVTGFSVLTSRSKRSSFGRSAGRILLAATSMILAVLFFLVAQDSAGSFLSADNWFARSPVREIILFLIMGTGMIARMLSIAIEERSARRAKLDGAQAAPPLRFDGWDMLYPFLSSSICFGALAESVSSMELNIPVFLLAFQNGFFWQTVLGSVRSKS